MKTVLRHGLLACIALSLAGCIAFTPKKTVRGNLPPASEIDKITVGSPKSEVLDIFGPPLSVGAFDQRTLIYLNRHTEAFAFFDPKITKYKLLAFRLDEQNKVREIIQRNINAIRTPPQVTDTTPSATPEPSWLDEILGNIGRFNAPR